MQLHHLHSLPCYKAHPGTKDLQIFRVFPSHQAATAQGITGLTKLFESTSFNSIQYTHPSFWTSPRETTESHWNSSDNCMLLSFCPIFFYKLLWENRNTQECYRKVSFWIWFMTWKWQKNTTTPTPNKKNAVIFVLTKIGCFKPTLQIIVTHRERGKQAALHGTTFEADFDDSCLRHGISKHRNTLNI